MATEMTSAERIQPGTHATSKPMLWTGRVIGVLVVLFMGVMPAYMLLAKPSMVAEGMSKHGYPSHTLQPIILVEIICAILYAIPQTAVLGAILLTGYLGGAVATHVRIGEPYYFPIIFGVLVWLGLFFRDARVRALAPLRM